ncbi:hypothetical protein KUCAC02_032864, partial [Chaenocephalus aceratus]
LSRDSEAVIETAPPLRGAACCYPDYKVSLYPGMDLLGGSGSVPPRGPGSHML